MTLERHSQGAFWCPTTRVNPAEGRMAIDAQSPTPLRKRLCNAVERHSSGIGLVVRLFNRRRPLAVFRRVWAVIVPALKRVLGAWAKSHVGDEILKTLPPSLADHYPASAIARMGLDVTSFAHRPPNAPFGRMAQTVRRVALGCPVALKAATGLCVATTEFVCVHAKRLAALTLTQPPAHVPFNFGRAFNGCKPPEFLPRQIQLFWHNNTEFRVSVRLNTI
jgi:hypothetical protein